MKKLLFIIAVFFTSQNLQAQTCDCNVSGWKPFTATVAKAPAMTVNCGHQFAVLKGKAFKLGGAYTCKGTCTTTYTAVLKNLITGAVIQNYGALKLPWVYTFTEAGNYKLEIIPHCGNKNCSPCIFYFTVG